MAGNATMAAARVVIAVASGQPVTVSAEVKAQRVALCLVCPNMIVSADGTAHRCAVCGCWLDGKILCKACLTTESCPAQKWGAA